MKKNKKVNILRGKFDGWDVTELLVEQLKSAQKVIDTATDELLEIYGEDIKDCDAYWELLGEIAPIEELLLSLDTLISDEVFLSDDLEEENPHKVTYSNSVFKATSWVDGSVRLFELLKEPKDLTEEESENVLNYCFAEFTGKVELRDIFLEGTFIKELK
jgi:hypothetical protein